VDGGNGADTLNVTGTTSSDTLGVVFSGSALTGVAGGTLAGVEAIVADLQGGSDTLSYAGSTAAVTVDLGAGSASGFASIAGVENVTGGNGNDLLISADGVFNVMTGGAGNDTFVVHDVLDIALESSGGGTDEVLSYAGLYMIIDGNVENLTFVGTGNFTGLGNNSANVITGGSGDDQLYGLGGGDTLNGGAGNDMLDGGSGDNTLNGGAGNDRIDGGAGNDILVFAPSFGNDRVDDFDAAPLGGQDRLDFTAFGFTAASFATSVSISVSNIDGVGDLDTLVTVGTDSIAFLGVNGVGENVITQADFIL
jgi:Ca2+-binding RTX toxin-like protein